MSKLYSKYTTIYMCGKELKVRTHIYNDDRSKKTLLMTHGYLMSAVYFAFILPALSEHYRIVMVDNLAWGLNTRTDYMGDALSSPEKAEKWLITWWEKLVEALAGDLPEKFYVSGHSAGGYQLMLYACYHPERIEAMFLQSPSCFIDTTVPGFVDDIYDNRISDESSEPAPRWLVTKL